MVYSYGSNAGLNQPRDSQSPWVDGAHFGVKATRPMKSRISEVMPYDSQS